jgi:hypothetical protein
VVHYCEHVHGAKTLAYYHMLVKLDKEFIPFEWSNVFHFNRVGIQYCIGFTILDEGFAFWFSEHDGNPGFLRIYTGEDLKPHPEGVLCFKSLPIPLL